MSNTPELQTLGYQRRCVFVNYPCFPGIPIVRIGHSRIRRAARWHEVRQGPVSMPSRQIGTERRCCCMAVALRPSECRIRETNSRFQCPVRSGHHSSLDVLDGILPRAPDGCQRVGRANQVCPSIWHWPTQGCTTNRGGARSTCNPTASPHGARYPCESVQAEIRGSACHRRSVETINHLPDPRAVEGQRPAPLRVLLNSSRPTLAWIGCAPDRTSSD